MIAMKSIGFTDLDVPDLTGKTALVTGANTGLGFETARVLAARGARVILACRSREKAKAALQEIQHESPEADVSFLQLDLGDLASIRAAVESLGELEQLDLLINNAGIMVPPYTLTVDGFESQFGVNHLGPFALTGLMLDKLLQTPGARVVNTSSLAARRGQLLLGDVNAERGYDAMQRYSMSKLANLLYSLDLDRRLKAAGAECISVACHPGVANTELSRYLPRWFTLAEPLVKHLFNTSAEGAWPTLQAATDPAVRGGEYFGPSCRWQTVGPSMDISTGKTDQTLAGELWRVSESMTGVSYL